MSTRAYLLLSVIAAAFVFFELGATVSSLVLVAVMSALFYVPWYFGTRSRKAEPSRGETVAAAAWLWLRRVFCVIGAVIFFCAAAALVLLRTSPSVPEPWWLLAAFAASLGVFLVYVAVVGQGPDRYAWRDDISLYRHNKRRYKWWF